MYTKLILMFLANPWSLLYTKVQNGGHIYVVNDIPVGMEEWQVPRCLLCGGYTNFINFCYIWLVHDVLFAKRLQIKGIVLFQLASLLTICHYMVIVSIPKACNAIKSQMKLQLL